MNQLRIAPHNSGAVPLYPFDTCIEFPGSTNKTTRRARARLAPLPPDRPITRKQTLRPETLGLHIRSEANSHVPSYPPAETEQKNLRRYVTITVLVALLNKSNVSQTKPTREIGSLYPAKKPCEGPHTPDHTQPKSSRN